MRAVPFVLGLLAASAFASSGDRSPDFESCVSRCGAARCQQPHPLPLALRITRWTCTDDCKYDCMHQITDRDIGDGSRVQQYYGKWPFWRFAGMQEPASVAFSLLNLWAHIRGVSSVRKRVPKEHPMRPYYIWWAAISANAWVWSAVFHTRDVPITEKLDYFSAALAILYALYYTGIRMYHLYPPAQKNRLTISPDSPPPRVAYKIWTFLCIAAYAMHITYLTLLPRFDYAYNMAFNVVVGLIHNLLWLLYSLPSSLSVFRRFPSQPKTYRPKYAGKAALFCLLTTAATALELFDFPPWGRVIDAHSLWHLSTVPICAYWYRFLLEDALDSSWTLREYKA